VDRTQPTNRESETTMSSRRDTEHLLRSIITHPERDGNREGIVIAEAWQSHFAREHDPSRVLGERNVFRYRPCRGVLVRGEAASHAGWIALCQVVHRESTARQYALHERAIALGWPPERGPLARLSHFSNTEVHFCVLKGPRPT
jgi:hypothetical protein